MTNGVTIVHSKLCCTINRSYVIVAEYFSHTIRRLTGLKYCMQNAKQRCNGKKQKYPDCVTKVFGNNNI